MVAHAIGVAACVVEAWAEHCPESFYADHIGYVIKGREDKKLLGATALNDGVPSIAIFLVAATSW